MIMSIMIRMVVGWLFAEDWSLNIFARHTSAWGSKIMRIMMMMAIDDNDNGDDVDDDVDDSCPMVVRGRLKLAQPPTTSLPFLSLPRLSQYLLCWFVYFQCWLLSISEGEGLCIYDLNFECFRWTSLQALILLDIWKTTSLPFLSLPRLSIIVMLVCVFPMLTF